MGRNLEHGSLRLRTRARAPSLPRRDVANEELAFTFLALLRTSFVIRQRLSAIGTLIERTPGRFELHNLAPEESRLTAIIDSDFPKGCVHKFRAPRFAPTASIAAKDVHEGLDTRVFKIAPVGRQFP